VATWAVIMLTAGVTALASVLTTLIRAYREIRIRRERNQLIRDALERGDSTNLLIVALTTSEQASEENHNSKVIKSLSYLPPL
jgi:hypothetical protein